MVVRSELYLVLLQYALCGIECGLCHISQSNCASSRINHLVLGTAPTGIGMGGRNKLLKLQYGTLNTTQCSQRLHLLLLPAAHILNWFGLGRHLAQMTSRKCKFALTRYVIWSFKDIFKFLLFNLTSLFLEIVFVFKQKHYSWRLSDTAPCQIPRIYCHP